ncbi:MAG: ketopantoate reductase C-terminal domain-containing protein [Alphaproteobacteria bacterium]
MTGPPPALVRALVRAMMGEVQAIGGCLGVGIPINVDHRIDGAAKAGARKTSMFQDLETGRAMKIDALAGPVAERGHPTEVAPPAIDAVVALVQQRGRMAGCYK